MRLICFFLIINLGISFASTTYAQATLVSLNLNNNSIASILEAVEKQTDYSFVYDARIVNTNKTTSINVENRNVFDVLNQLFTDTDISFTVVNKKIVLNNKKGIETLQQQTKILTGFVVDQNGEPIIGANVVEKGTTNGTITDMTGMFRLNVQSDAFLVFTYIGYNSIEIKAADNLRIKMIEDTQALDEVIVVGYGTMKKSDITGSITSVKAEQLKDVSVTNAAKAIQGKAAGVDIVSSGQKPGDGSTIRIRGTRSFQASNDPLYVIDGIPFNRWINDLNPADIESIEILKDASATAIYGSRGANGVILITTKRAKAGTSLIELESYYGFQKAQKTYDMMNGAEFLEMNREANRRHGNYPDGSAGADKDISILKYKDDYVIQSIQAAYDDAGVYNPYNIRSYDWGDEALQTGIVSSHQLRFTGGNDKSKVMLSAGYYKNEGIVVGQDYERYSFRLNADYKLNNWFDFGGSTAFTYGTKNEGSNIYSNTLRMNPLAAPTDEEGNSIDRPGNDPTLYNPLYDTPENFVSEQSRYRFLGSFFFNLNLGKGFKYRMNLGTDFGLLRTGNYRGTNSFARAGGLSTATKAQEQYISLVLENLLYYDRTFGKHKFGITIMQGAELENREDLKGEVQDLPYEHQLFYNLGSASTITGVGSDLIKWRMLSYMGRFNYTFDEKYMITLTGRYDGSSRLSDGHKFTFFPSVALAWRMNQEGFLRDVAFIDNLKLRVGYGRTGNSSVEPYATLGSLSRTTYATDDTPVYGYKPNLLYNPQLAWEKTGQYNIGVDLSVLNGRVSMSLDAYQQKTTDLLLNRQLPTASGFSSITQNIGSTKNTGVELTLSTVNVESKSGFFWSTDFMFYANKEEILSLYQGKVDDVGNKWFIGHPINTYYDYQFDGIWQNTQADLDRMALFNANGATFSPGDIKLLDIDGNDKITSEDRMILGSTVPKWTASITNTFKYKGIDLSFFFYARYGQKERSSTSFLTLDGRYNSLNIDYWTPDNPSNKYPRPDNKRESPNYIGTITYEDASFLKLKNITLGYTLPNTIMKKTGLKACRIYMTSENPIVLTDFTGLDPEGGEQITPSTMSLLMGLNITF